MSALEILQPGPQALIQDGGRLGLASIGVGRSGAADRSAYELGGRLVAHDEGLAALEITFGGLIAWVHGPMTVALTGADCGATLEGHPIAHAAPLDLRDGQELRLGMPSAGLRTYLTARGGWDVPPVLGSRSTDTLSGLGPAPVKVGTMLPVGDYEGSYPNVDVAPVPLPTRETVTLRVLPGPRKQWFAEPDALSDQEWTVSERSNRVGIRLTGESLRRDPHRRSTRGCDAHGGGGRGGGDGGGDRGGGGRDAELPSEGMVRGCLQVPPDGQPVLFLNDHPVTGGYPVIGVVTMRDTDRAAQVQPGQKVRFRWMN